MRPWKTGIVVVAMLGTAAVLRAGEGPQPNPADRPGKSRPLVTVGKQTTRITKPLDEDGYPDYLAALNELLARGVTPENNASVLFWKAMGPAEIDPPLRERFFKMLGIEPLSDKGDYYVTLEAVAERLKKDGEEESTPRGEEGGGAMDLSEEQDRVMKAPWTAKDYPRAAAWMAANERPMALLMEASKRPRHYSPLLSGDESGMVVAVLLPEVSQIREAARALTARAMLRLGEGKVEEACEDLLAAHRLARLAGQGVTVIDGLVAIAIDATACRGDAALLASGRLSAAQARRMRAELAKLAPIADLTAAIDAGERFMYLDAVTHVARHGMSELCKLANGGENAGMLGKLTDVAVQMAVDWDAILRKGNQWYDRLVEAGRKPTRAAREEALDRIDKDISALAKEAKDPMKTALAMLGDPRRAVSERIGDIFVALLLPAIGTVFQAEDRWAMSFEITKLGFALAAYRAEKGAYPAKLEDLVPKYVDTVPTDVFSGGPLVYRPRKGGYSLYSVGVNGRDDGGLGYDDRDEQANRSVDLDDLVLRVPAPRKPKRDRTR